MPGKALKILEAASELCYGSLVTAQSVDDAPKNAWYKISVASSGDEREKLLNLETLIHQRMINQSRAVTALFLTLFAALVLALETKTGRLALSCFLGPTGVGKLNYPKRWQMFILAARAA